MHMIPTSKVLLMHPQNLRYITANRRDLSITYINKNFHNKILSREFDETGKVFFVNN